MQRVFTSEFTRARIKAICNTRKFGDRTACPNCGYRHKFYKLSDGRWQCKRCDKRFGLLTDTITDTKINRTELNLQEIYELLFWFELELTGHKIANSIDGNYQKTHRFYNKVRERLFEYEEDSKSLDHGDQEYKRGKATINGIEGFWGYAKERLLKHDGVSLENF